MQHSPPVICPLSSLILVKTASRLKLDRLKMAGEARNFAATLQGIVSFQALYRGHRTRKAMKSTRDEFTLIFNELEGENSCMFNIDWHSQYVVGRPAIIKPTKKINSGLKTDSFKQTVELNKEDIIPGFPDRLSAERPDEIGTVVDEHEEILDDRSRPSANPTTPNTSSKEKDQNEGTASDQQMTAKNDSLIEDMGGTADSFSDLLLQPSVNDCRKLESKNLSRDPQTCEQGNKKNNAAAENQLREINLEKIRSMKKVDILEKKKEIQMELIWIQQAIESRKQYIKLKG